MTRYVVLLGLLGLLTVACGASRDEVAPAAAPAPQTVAPVVTEEPDSKGAAAAPPPAPVISVAPRAETTGRGGETVRARSDLAAAENQLRSSAGDCVTACRALGSMERATAHLCTLAVSSDDQAACQDARSRVLAGRDRVRSSCGDCPGGPSLDRSAPIPSTR